MDNMWLGRFPKVSNFLPFTSEKKMYDETMKIFKDLDINVDPKTVMSTMSVSQRQMVEIAKALSMQPRLLLLDEPAAGMNPNETGELMDMIRFVRDEFHMTILLIEHDMKLVMGICERITVLNYGMMLASGGNLSNNNFSVNKIMLAGTLNNKGNKACVINIVGHCDC